LVAHRGESELEAENTLPAFTAAAKNGFALEMDLYLSRDGVVFCTHDNRIWQKHSGLPSGAWVTNLNWKGQLDKADAGAWKGEKWKGTGYARLEEVLPLIGKYGVWAIVEIKDPRKELIMSKVRPIIESFDFLAPSNIVMAGAGTFMPGYESTATCLMRDGWLADDKPRNLLGYARRLNPNTVALFSPRWDSQLVTEELVAAAHSRGVKVAVWTVNDAGIALEALRRGVDYVLSDRPIDMYREMREAYKAAWKSTGKNIAIPGFRRVSEPKSVNHQ
jgi:glycerophosphoryl diester phosphodiesterase